MYKIIPSAQTSQSWLYGKLSIISGALKIKLKYGVKY